MGDFFVCVVWGFFVGLFWVFLCFVFQAEFLFFVLLENHD